MMPKYPEDPDVNRRGIIINVDALNVKQEGQMFAASVNPGTRTVIRRESNV